MRELDRASSETAREGLAQPPSPLRPAHCPLDGREPARSGPGGRVHGVPDAAESGDRADLESGDRADPVERGAAQGLGTIVVVGRGRLGHALVRALARAGLSVEGPLGRDAVARGDVVLLCVPDGQIAAAARQVRAGRLVGHCSGATGLDVLGQREGFSLHPLMTVVDGDTQLSGAGCAIAATSVRALGVARALARALEMRPVVVADSDRAAYHAAASMASNFLVALEGAAERLAATAGVERALLVPLVRAAVNNWANSGPERALTGPIVRGDHDTVVRQREAVAARAPELVVLFDALADVTRTLAGGAPAATNGRERAP